MAIKEIFESNTDKIDLATQLLSELSGREGMYVWKKYAKTITYTAYCTGCNGSAWTFTVDSDDIDLSKYDDLKVLGSFNIKASISGGYVEVKSDDCITYYYYLSGSKQNTLTPSWDKSTKTLTLTGTCPSSAETWANQYYEVTTPFQGEFLGFIVSDDASAYPEDGEQDGYWYELVEEGGNAEYGEVTLTAKTTSITISHSLKQTPAHVGIIKKDLKRVLNLTWAIVDNNLQAMGTSYMSYDYTTNTTKDHETVTFTAPSAYSFAATTYVWFVSK